MRFSVVKMQTLSEKHPSTYNIGLLLRATLGGTFRAAEVTLSLASSSSESGRVHITMSSRIIVSWFSAEAEGATRIFTASMRTCWMY